MQILHELMNTRVKADTKLAKCYTVIKISFIKQGWLKR
jgi:hypothetical protein